MQDIRPFRVLLREISPLGIIITLDFTLMHACTVFYVGQRELINMKRRLKNSAQFWQKRRQPLRHNRKPTIQTQRTQSTNRQHNTLTPLFFKQTKLQKFHGFSKSPNGKTDYLEMINPQQEYSICDEQKNHTRPLKFLMQRRKYVVKMLLSPPQSSSSST